MRGLFRDLLRTLDEYGYEWEEMIEVGDHVVTVMRSWRRGRGSGIRVESRSGQLWTFREGRVVRFRAFPDKARALEAAGLPSPQPAP